MSRKKVGPGHPPVETRFPKGKSGNIEGRPKGRGKAAPEDTGSAFDLVIRKRLPLSQGGVTRELTVEEALHHRTYQDAIAGNRSAQNEVLKWIRRREKALANQKGRSKIEVENLIEPADPKNADQALQILGIASVDPVLQDQPIGRTPLLLEPWAVQMALSRRRGGTRLTDDEIKEIRRCTRDPETLSWPRSTSP